MEISNEIMERIERILQEEVRHYEAHIRKLEKKLEETPPMPAFAAEHLQKGLVMFRDGSDTVIIQKRKLEILNYALGSMVVELPESLKYKTRCWIGALFNRELKCHEFRLYTRHFSPLQTFHTNDTHICLGDVSGVEQGVDIAKPDTLLAAFGRIMDMLQTLNPLSPLHHPKKGKLGDIWTYVCTEYHRWQRENCQECGKRTGEMCSHCNLCGDCCECYHCDDCGTAYDADASCSNCDSCSSCCRCRGEGND